MRVCSVLIALSFGVPGPVLAAEQILVLPPFSMAPSNINSFNTPVAYWNGNIYTANVEPGSGMGVPGVNLKTVVRKCALGSATTCTWERKVVDAATLDDIYHTQPSIAVDRAGFVHVAYNMHHMPWQYSVSRRAGDISAFDFLGESLSAAQKSIVKLVNKTPFPSIGNAAIPGNQITYPAFYHDRNLDLYVTYRFAIRPKLAFADRAYAGGIAAYDIDTKKWHSIGGEITVTSNQADLPKDLATTEVKAFAFADGWQALPIRLTFDENNGMHAVWAWRKHEGNSAYTKASYAYSPDKGKTFRKADGSFYELPIAINATDAPFTAFGFPKTSLTADADLSVATDLGGQPYFVAVPKGRGSQLTFFRKTKGRWENPENMPLNARRLEIDDDGRQWVFSTGLKVMRRDSGQDIWTKIYEDRDANKYGWPKIYSLPNERLFIVHTLNSQVNKVKIYIIRY